MKKSYIFNTIYFFPFIMQLITHKLMNSKNYYKLAKNWCKCKNKIMAKSVNSVNNMIVHVH